MSVLREAQAILRRAGQAPDRDIAPAETALALAALERPEAGFERYRHHLSLLARDVADVFASTRSESEDDLAARASALAFVLTERYGYRGDRETYDDLQNANLMRVIDRRQGLPVALGILYIHAARAQGWTMVGLNFPGHILLGLEHAGMRAILDPFDALAPRGTAELRGLLRRVGGPDAELTGAHTQALTNRDLLLRLQNNRKVRLLQESRTEAAVETIEAMLLLAPAHATLWREAGLLHANLGNLRAAVLALEQVVDLSEDPARRNEAAMLLGELRSRIN